MVSQSISHYRIVKKLGAGGMGEVYLAEDTKLDRRVALKILPENFAGDAERMRRFVQEAKAASALNHPNILTIHEIGETTGTHYIATEFIEGESLRHHIERPRPKLCEVLEVMMQVASALSAAHQSGIIHRDIKPENIMLRPDGYVKVLDFGLAKLTEKRPRAIGSDVATISKKGTDPGTVMGTVQYMSPEQARGKEVDARSDIFSVGVVLYEMVAGRPPFAGESSTDVLAAILDRESPPLSRYADETPAELQRIVSKCLRKSQDERYQTMKDVLLDLKELRDELALEAKLERSVRPATSNTENQQTLIAKGEITGEAALQTGAARGQATSSAEYLVNEIKQYKRGIAVTLLIVLLAAIGLGYWYFFNRASGNKQIESIAVMPFVNESGNPDVEYLSDGMTEMLISSLSQLPNLNVKARSSVFRYKGKEFDVQKIAQELKVQAILAGRVAQRGGQLTLSLELIDAQTENVIWSEQYNRQQADLVALQSEIARDVSSKLKSKLSGADETKLAKNKTVSTEAYQAYLKGLFYYHQFTDDSMRKAIEQFNQAIYLDPNYAQAYAGLGLTYTLMSSVFLPPSEAMPKAKQAVLKTLALDGSLAEAHRALAEILLWGDWDFPAAEQEFKRAIELNPNDPITYIDYAMFLALTLERFDEAIALSDQALKLDPSSFVVHRDAARTFYFARLYDRTIVEANKMLEMDSNSAIAHGFVGRVYLLRGQYEQAIAELQKARDLRGEVAIELSGHLYVAYAIAGRKSEALKGLAEIQELSNRKYVPPSVIALIYAGLGEKDRAFEWLEKAYQGRDDNLLHLKTEPLFYGLHPDPRFKDLVKRVGLPEGI